MSISLVNPVTELVNRLEVDGALTALVTGGDVAVASAAVVRLYGGSLPSRPIVSTQIPGAIAPALVFQLAGGPFDRYLEMKSEPRIEIRAYGPSHAANLNLWIEAVEACRRMPRNSAATWMECNLNVIYPVQRTEPETGWRYQAGFITLNVLAH
jgi:hypothetical protein